MHFGLLVPRHAHGKLVPGTPSMPACHPTTHAQAVAAAVTPVERQAATGVAVQIPCGAWAVRVRTL